jgi:hypothetical protein
MRRDTLFAIGLAIVQFKFWPLGVSESAGLA